LCSGGAAAQVAAAAAQSPAVGKRLITSPHSPSFFSQADLRDKVAVAALFARAAVEGPFDAVIHFAALKAVGESVAQPLAYYENNIAVG